MKNKRLHKIPILVMVTCLFLMGFTCPISAIYDDSNISSVSQNDGGQTLNVNEINFDAVPDDSNISSVPQNYGGRHINFENIVDVNNPYIRSAAVATCDFPPCDGGVDKPSIRPAVETVRDLSPYHFAKMPDGSYAIIYIDPEKIHTIYNFETLETERVSLMPMVHNNRFVNYVHKNAFNDINTFNNDPQKNKGLKVRLDYICKPEIWDDSLEVIKVAGNNKLGGSKKRKLLPTYVRFAKDKSYLLPGNLWTKEDERWLDALSNELSRGEKNADTQE